MRTTRPTVGEVARSALAALNVTRNDVLAAQWVNERWQQLAAVTTLRSLRKTGEFVVPAPVTDGTVSVSRGTNVVTGDATAYAAWSPTLVGRYFQVQGRDAWYEITDVTATTLILAVPFAEDDAAAGSSYHVVARHLALPSTVRRLGWGTCERRRWPVKTVSSGWLDRQHPSRQYVTTGPAYMSEVRTDESGARVIEVYPYSTTTEHVAYKYVQAPPTIELGDTLPGQIDTWMLKVGVLADVMLYKAAQCVDGQDLQGAAYWRNEFRVQEGRFEDAVRRAIQADRGTDDLEAWLQSSLPLAVTRDITTARDQVWSS